MSDITTAPFEAQSTPAQLTTSWVEDLPAHVKGLVSTLALAFVGMFVVVVALMVGVVGAPVIAVAIAYAVTARRRATRMRAPTPA